MSDEKTCKTCRHHSEERKPRPQQPVVNAAADYVGVVFSDVDEVMYSCRAPRGEHAPHAGREVGFDPVTCAAYEEGARLTSAERASLSEAVERMQSRLAARRREVDQE